MISSVTDLVLEVLKRTVIFNRYPNWATVEHRLKTITKQPVLKEAKGATVHIEGKPFKAIRFKCTHASKPYIGTFSEELKFLHIEELNVTK